MKSKLARLIVAAGIAGVVCGQLLCASPSFRNALGHFSGRGNLVALIHSAGIYEADLTRQPKEQLIAEAEISYRSRGENVSRAAIHREYDLLESQFADKPRWTQALRENRLCWWSLRSRLTNNLRSRKWIERQFAGEVAITEDECRAYYQAHAKEFSQPERFHVAHLFLAAPTGTPEELVAVKRRTIEQLLERIDKGEKFSDLVAAFSDDDATKKSEGDLGYFSDFRMPEDFMAAVRQLHPGETSRVVQTALGFHLIHLLDVKPARLMEFAEAQPAIRGLLEDGKRHVALAKLVTNTSEQGPLGH